MKKLFLTSLIIIILSFSAYGQSDSDKASLILKFIDNLEWSKNGPNGNDSIIVGIVGETSLLAMLENKIASKKEKISLRSKSYTDDLSECHVIFTPAKELKDLAKILKKLNKTNIVSISNAKDFARYGIMINLIEDGSKIKYEVNQMVLESIGVKLSSKIMKKAIKI